jgi:uncharacterized protein YecE (DUF72 family)
MVPSQLHIGISGWLYGPWRGTFYPEGLRLRDQLAYASRKVGSVEINGTFYSLQRPECFRLWREQTPDGFVFSVKGSRFITHMKKLRDVETALANFYASGLLLLGDKLGPVLWQFPANMSFDEPRFSAFFDRLPRTTREAARLARRHDERVEGRCFTGRVEDAPIRYAVEIRHASFLGSGFLELLRRHNIALVFSDAASKWPYAEDLTADFVYVRLHGSQELYVSGYTPAELDRWADRVRRWAGGGYPADAVHAIEPPRGQIGARDVYVYFDNDAKVHAPFDAMGLMERLDVRPREQDALPPLVRRARARPTGSRPWQRAPRRRPPPRRRRGWPRGRAARGW